MDSSSKEARKMVSFSSLFDGNDWGQRNLIRFWAMGDKNYIAILRS
jgi:hypothetical protein